ncbi:MAG: CDGSH iron-sulfur domain-containing protein [Actinomycetota bacterium]
MTTAEGDNGDIQTSIQPSDNGPYLVRGPVSLVDPDGNEIVVKGKNIALCRCGASENKPFCDGTHSKIGFESRVRASGIDV